MVRETKITIETDSLLIVRGRSARRAWCSVCSAEVESLAVGDAGAISNLDLAVLEKWLHCGNLHRLETTGESGQICLNSLVARVQKATTR